MTFADFAVAESWGTGFVGMITFENFTSDLLNGWIFEFEAPFQITNLWDGAIIQQQGNRYIVRNAQWNGQAYPNEQISFGFVGTLANGTTIEDSSAQPSAFLLNGMEPDANFVQTQPVASFRVVKNSGNDRFMGYLTVENTTPELFDGWTFEFTAPFEIKEIWDAEIVRSRVNFRSDGRGDRYLVKNVEWNPKLAPGQKLSFGFVADLQSGSIDDIVNRPRDFTLAAGLPDAAPNRPYF